MPVGQPGNHVDRFESGAGLYTYASAVYLVNSIVDGGTRTPGISLNTICAVLRYGKDFSGTWLDSCHNSLEP